MAVSADDNLWQGVDGVNNPCPVGYRLPTESEWDAERGSWSSNNSSGAYGSPLKLPVAGYRRNVDGSLSDVGSIGDYWSSSVDGSFARRLFFSSSDADMFSDFRARGFSVRCLKHVEESGPTEVTSTTGAVWMDRNLGASQVATSSTDAGAYGDLYQWGRGADGHEKRDSETTSTLSTTDTPGHGDFITSDSDWRSTQNDNLWQGVDGVNNPCPAGFRLPTQAEWETERTSWSSNNSSGAYGSPLKLPVAGNRNYGDGSLLNVGSYGLYWSSSVAGAVASYLYFISSSADMNSGNRAFGFSVRCRKD
jgi:Fibrobacter succinogenes major domain (Fib_succ_major).